MKRKKTLVYDIFIYGSLIIAIALLSLGGISYFYSLKEKSNLKTELNGAIKELKGEEEIPSVKLPEEPENMKYIDKTILVTDYLHSIYDQKTKDDTLTYEIISTWESYEVVDIKYAREISSNYHSYLVNIKINNTNAKLPNNKNEELSKNDYLVTTLNVNISYSDTNHTYTVKSFNIPIEK